MKEHVEMKGYRDQMFITVEELSKIMRISRSMAYKYVAVYETYLAT